MHPQSYGQSIIAVQFGVIGRVAMWLHMLRTETRQLHETICTPCMRWQLLVAAHCGQSIYQCLPHHRCYAFARQGGKLLCLIMHPVIFDVEWHYNSSLPFILG
jgi:hypothetical protein